MSIEGPDVHMLTGAYAADALDPDERERFEGHLQVCEACAQEVAELRATAARLAAGTAEPPPASLRTAVLAEIDRTRQEPPRTARTDRPPVGQPTRPWWSTTVTAVAAVAAAVLLVAVVATGVLPRSGGGGGGDHVAQLLTAPDVRMVEAAGPDGGLTRLMVSEARGEAVLVVSDWPDAPEGHTFQLWLISADEARPAGTFDVDADGRSLQPLTGGLGDSAAVGVTIEPDGGSTSPTTDPLAVLEL